jgi:uncharacterized protein (TIGR02145 family)
MYLINVTGNTFQYSGKILSSGQANGNSGVEKVSNTAESNIEKISKKEFKAKQGTVDMYYAAGERLKFKAISGIYRTVKTDIPAEDKTLSFNFIPCTDGDNNNYSVVEIGGQVWMAENLKTTKYNDNSDIPLGADIGEWNALSTPGYCWYNNDEAANKATYGALYNWYTVNTGKLCPTGWHVPADAEWIILTGYPENISAGKLKEVGLSHWESPNADATNETGFTALPGGSTGAELMPHFFGIGKRALWLCSTEFSFSHFPRWGLISNDNEVSMYYSYKFEGLSVRCLRYLTSITTLNVEEITTVSAKTGGEITNDSGNPVIASGVCWSTHENPTIVDGLVTNISELDSFTCLITGLTTNTKYYVRAFATNSLGTSYGNEIMFATKGETGTVSDMDGNTYSTIEIGTQTWIAENLKTTKYNDDSAIPLVEDPGAWVELSTPGYCWYNNDVANFKATCGALYNWYTVSTGKLCPTGWHVPTDAEWKTLEIYIGMTQSQTDIEGFRGTDQGIQLKNTSGWNFGGNGTNTTGFTALPGGYRNYNSSFDGGGYYGGWWSSVANDNNLAWFRNLNYDISNVYRGYHNKGYGFSVRCLQDE